MHILFQDAIGALMHLVHQNVPVKRPPDVSPLWAENAAVLTLQRTQRKDRRFLTARKQISNRT